MLDDVYSELEERFEKIVTTFRRDLMKVRTGRANLGMLDGIKVEFYGTLTPLNQVGTMKVPDPRLITIQPWDKTLIGTIEKAIVASELGLNPSNDGNLIRIPIPPLTGERRQELVKIVKRQGEDTKVSIRAERREANDLVKELEKSSEIGEDDMRRGLDKIQKLTDKYIEEVDDVVREKERDILEG
ncbi:MAG: ribosome recycling factor [Bradymonadales bacterium]|nr:ribosome recycling factor [Bradymonadales bacterium]